MDDGLFEPDDVTQTVNALLRELYRTEGWPVDPERDAAFLKEMLHQYPGLDLKDELGAFRVWLLQQTPREREKMVKSSGRLRRLRNWCARAVGGGPAGRKGGAKRRTSTEARPREAFGDESSQSLSRW